MKVFRNKMDKYHFFGGVILGIIAILMFFEPLFFMKLTYYFTMVLILTSPFWWEKWDEFKVLYNDKRTEKWSNFAKLVFTSEGKADNVDMLLSYAGLFIGMMLISFIIRLLLYL